jgi:hypothetical protein
MDRTTITVIVALSVFVELLAAFAALYFAGVIPGLPEAQPAVAALSFVAMLSSLAALFLMLAAHKRGRQNK